MKIKLDENLPASLVATVTAIADELESWGGCFVVATENKIRVKRP